MTTAEKIAAAETSADAASTRTALAAAAYAGALAAFLADPSFANSERLYATESAFVRARAEEALAKSDVLLAMLAA